MPRMAETYRGARRNRARLNFRFYRGAHKAPRLGALMDKAMPWCTQRPVLRGVGSAAVATRQLALVSAFEAQADDQAGELARLTTERDTLEVGSPRYRTLTVQIEDLARKLAWSDQWASGYDQLWGNTG